MLREVADGVLVHTSGFCLTNTVVVRGDDGVLVVDAGITESELVCLADDLDRAALSVVAGFSTHPHWDHLLWHDRLGDVPRHATSPAEATVRERLPDAAARARVAAMMPPEIAGEVPLDRLGEVTGLPDGTTYLPWSGPAVRVVEHRGHAPGHAALLVEGRGVLVAGDMLSDVLVPMLDPGDPDAVSTYLAALDLLEQVAGDAAVVVPGHGSVGEGEVRARVERDRAYVAALLDPDFPGDPRVGAAAPVGWEWVTDVHEGQRSRLLG